VSVRAAVAALVLGFLAEAPPARPLADDSIAYSFAVVPQAPPERIRAVWLPIVERLSASAHVPLRLQLYATGDEFQADLLAGKVDFAYVNPVQAIRAYRTVGYRPLIRDATTLRGVFFVAADSPYKTVESLAGHEVVFIGPLTLCSQSLQAYTRELKIHPTYVGTAANAFKSVLLGLVAAGGVLDTNIADAPAEVRARLRIIYETPPMAPHAMVAHPRIPADVSGRLAAALLEVARAEGAGLLSTVHLANPVEAAFGRDYAKLEQVIFGAPDPAPAGRAR
jgi:phosphonate transport system substrate-binding protein